MPSALKREIRSNFDAFDAQWKADATLASTNHTRSKDVFAESYLRIASFQAWRTSVIEPATDADSAAFFFEGQNDLLVSHCLANFGSFRQALKSLRSAIENVLFTLYYKDHPVELQKWNAGDHKLSFSELISYITSHPSCKSVSENDNGIAVLKAEYSTLSKAVHASAKQFRMTTNSVENRLWVNDPAMLGMWGTREKFVISALNLLLIYFFTEELKGAANTNLRQVISLVVPTSRATRIKADLGVNLSFRR